MVKMETDTLSNYEQAQDKHVLDDNMDINIPRNDDEVDESHQNKDDQPLSKGNISSSEDTESHKVNNCESSENKENENESDSQIHLENSVNNDKKSETEEEKSDNDTINNGKESEAAESEEEKAEVEDEDDRVDKTVDSEAKDPLALEDAKENDISNSEQKGGIEKGSKKEDSNSEETVNKDKNKEANVVSSDDEETINKDPEDSPGKHFPLLKETLSKPRSEDEQPKEADKEDAMEDIDDDDFDPSLLCPDIAMEVDEAPVITSNEPPPVDGNKSPSLYEPMFSTYVDEMTGAEVSFNLSVEEHKLRQEMYGEANPVQYTKIHCTACNVHLGSALDGQSNRFVHPLLKVLICKDCYHFYTSGEFEKDEDGSELYCRWCGQGGQVICCSSCEMVFCKKCIRINYGRKKLTEIRDSDDWLCFRCDPSQLKLLRVHCAEFMEYVRREISRAATLENATSFMTTDYTQCCLAQKKKYVEPHPNEPKRKKRKSSVNDPDYDPLKDRSSPQPSTSGVTPATSTADNQKLVPILPKPIPPKPNPTVLPPNSTVFRVGNTTFRPRASTFSQPRPRVQIINPANAIRPQTTGPGYIKILPGGIRVPPSPPRTHTTFTPRQPYQPRQVRPPNNAQMKHEWFEKTVRAAARVNSNLSYTLTQLNRAQANATSVEALAVVHNKLQEILSTSINSLIQIRKNLRMEFIAGIKNIRFPPKVPPRQPQPQPSTSTQDDDVIFVSSPTVTVPPPLTPAPPAPPALAPVVHTPVTSINLPPSVSLTKRTPAPPLATSTPTTTSAPSTSSNGDPPKIFLRVKSLTALQSVTSECITIPDDPLPPPPPLTPIVQFNEVSLIETPKKTIPKEDEKCVEEVDSSTNKSENGKEGEVIENGEEKKKIEKVVEEEKRLENGSDEDIVQVSEDKKAHSDSEGAMAFDSALASSKELKKLYNVRVNLTRSEEVDSRVRQMFGLVNGDSSE